MAGLLTGLRVIEASSFVAAPTAGLYLAQLGAEVIRVDQIGGGPDFHRWPQGPSGSSLYWENLNRAKHSVALDLGRPEGRALLQRLAAATGVFVTNFPADGFLAHARLAAIRPDLVTVRVMGHADGTPALDYTVNAAVGLPGITGPATLGEEPVNHVLPAWDLLTGAYAAFALLAALRHRDATGEGQEVRIALADVAIGTVANLGMLAEAQMTGADRPRQGTGVYGAFGRAFTTRDGQRLMLLAITPRQWCALVRVLGIGEDVARIEAARGVSFTTDESLRYRHSDALYPLVEACVATWDYPALAAALEAEGGCFGAYRTMAEAARDPAMVVDNPLFGRTATMSGLDHPAAGSFAFPLALGRAPVRPAPRLGQDSAAVLGGLLGLDEAALSALQADGLVAGF